MRMNPNSTKLLRAETCIYLIIKEVCDRLIVESHMGQRAILLHKLQILHQQQIVLRNNPEATDFGVSIITQVQQFRPGCRAEPQLR